MNKPPDPRHSLPTDSPGTEVPNSPELDQLTLTISFNLADLAGEDVASWPGRVVQVKGHAARVIATMLNEGNPDVVRWKDSGNPILGSLEGADGA